MQETEVFELLVRAGAGMSVLEQLVRQGRLKSVEHRGHRYYLRSFAATPAMRES
jgi:hypothetical protein